MTFDIAVKYAYILGLEQKDNGSSGWGKALQWSKSQDSLHSLNSDISRSAVQEC